MENNKVLREAVVKIAFRYRDALMTYAFSMLRDWSLAEDVVQDVFIVVMNKWQDYQDGSSMYAWLSQIARRKIQETWRIRRRELVAENPELLEAVEKTMSEQLDAERADVLQQRKEALQVCFSKLDHGSLDLLGNFYWKRETCEAMALKTKRSPNAMRLSLSRVRQLLRECVNTRLDQQKGETQHA
ncbi:MAG: hypothetical protein C0404_01885 [Verrucomicrobia bacterium]|nr:hypothetical protein [Verrucomicrobiota bacterium]